MCGIAGVRRFGDTPITGEEIVLLLCLIEHRVLHASGIALENPDGLHVYKAAEPAWKFTKSKPFNDFLNEFLIPETRTAMLHTRWATKGSPEDNDNNHPMFDGETAAIHNGMISNDTWLFSSGKYERSCETDSDIIRAIVSEHGMNEKGIRELNKMTGSAAIAVLSTKYPDKFLLARSGSPCYYGVTDDQAKLYWASEPEAIIKASKPFKKVRGLWVQDTRANVAVGCMQDNTAWLFGPEGLELHHEFNTCRYYNKPDYSKGRENYHEKKKGWKNEQKRLAKKKSDDVVTDRKEADNSAYLKNSVAKCTACGQGCVNLEGKPWDTIMCSCGQRLG